MTYAGVTSGSPLSLPGRDGNDNLHSPSDPNGLSGRGGRADSPAAVSAGAEGLDQPSPPRPAFGKEASAGVIQARCVLIGNGPAFTGASGQRRLGPPLSVSARSKENLGFNNTRTLALRR